MVPGKARARSIASGNCGWYCQDSKLRPSGASWARSREGRHLLRTNLVEEDPAKLWSHYLLLVAVEEAFKNLKGDLAIRPIFHQLEARVEAHVFIAFLAYCLHVTLARRLHALAPGLTPRSVLEKFAAMQMIDVHLPTTDGRELLLTRSQQTHRWRGMDSNCQFRDASQPPTAWAL